MNSIKPILHLSRTLITPMLPGLVVWLLVTLGSAIITSAQKPRILESRVLHLRSGGTHEWDQFASRMPDGSRLDLRFESERNIRESTLLVFQDDVKLDWRLELNGRRLGKLFLMEAPLVNAVAIPVGVLIDGENRLSLIPPTKIDDIFIGRIELDPRPLTEALSEGTIEISVTQTDTDTGVPCRITLVNAQGELVPIHSLPGQNLAVRPGVVYTPDGTAKIGVRAGVYELYATRGVEFSLATQKISIKSGEHRSVQLEIRREVSTEGLASCDTHIHTFTHSGHGDATMDERVITLAGEGIELPIATDHEHLTDFSDAAAKMGVGKFFTPVIGCETTTPKGHFNSFPRPKGTSVPNHRETDWPRLMKSIRSGPEVRVVILNHPRNFHNNFQPFAPIHFNKVTGENHRGPEFEFDAIEVLNSSALQSDLMVGFRDWFALLNYGYRVTAVGSSDGHDVSRYIVGQGRTYIECDDDVPSKISVEAACKSIRDGRALVSMGLIARIRVEDQFRVGDLARVSGDTIKIEVTVLGPTWIEADHLTLFANGIPVREKDISANGRNGQTNPIVYDPIKAKITWDIPRPKHDVHLVAIASGPAVTEPYWAIPRPYQSSSTTWNPRVIGATNPVWVDSDNDGRFTAARGYAKQIVQKHGTEFPELIHLLSGYDSMIAAQTASLCAVAGEDLNSLQVMTAVAEAPSPVSEGIRLFKSALHASQVSKP